MRQRWSQVSRRPHASAPGARVNGFARTHVKKRESDPGGVLCRSSLHCRSCLALAATVSCLTCIHMRFRIRLRGAYSDKSAFHRYLTSLRTQVVGPSNHGALTESRYLLAPPTLLPPAQRACQQGSCTGGANVSTCLNAHYSSYIPTQVGFGRGCRLEISRLH